jgi:hypothetical protein
MVKLFIPINYFQKRFKNLNKMIHLFNNHNNHNNNNNNQFRYNKPIKLSFNSYDF